MKVLAPGWLQTNRRLRGEIETLKVKLELNHTTIDTLTQELHKARVDLYVAQVERVRDKLKVAEERRVVRPTPMSPPVGP